MMTETKIRQTIPRWSLKPDAALNETVFVERTARIIPLPLAAARNRRVLTYPAAIAVPARTVRQTQVPVLTGVAMLALAAPTAVLGGLGLLVLNILA